MSVVAAVTQMGVWWQAIPAFCHGWPLALPVGSGQAERGFEFGWLQQTQSVLQQSLGGRFGGGCDVEHSPLFCARLRT